MLIFLLWFIIGGLLWYRIYPDPSKFPHLSFLLLWPFLFGATLLDLIFKSHEKESRGKEE